MVAELSYIVAYLAVLSDAQQRWTIRNVLTVLLYVEAASSAREQSQHPRIVVPHKIEVVRPSQLSDKMQAYWIGQAAHIVSGSTLTIHCHATGYPKPKYTWQTSLGVIKNDRDRLHVQDNGTLTIAGVKMSDSGIVTCRAKNVLGKVERTSIIKVHEPVLGRCAPPIATFRTSSSITVQFTCPTGNLSDPYDCHVSSYRVKYEEVSKPTKTKEKMQAISASTVITGLEQFMSYTIQVQAVYNAPYCHKNRLKFSNPATVKTKPVGLGPPINVTVATLTSVSAVVTWSLPDHFTGRDVKFRVYCKEVPGMTNMLYPNEKNRVLLTGLQPFTRYKVYVKAVIHDEDLNGQVTKYQNTSSYLHFQTPQGAPSAPVNVSFHSLTSHSAVIFWSKPLLPNGRLSYYAMHYVAGNRQTCDTSQSNVSRVSQSSEVRLFHLEPFTSYCIWVTAVNIRIIDRQHLTSNSSNMITFTTPSTVILPPHDVTVDNILAHSVLVKWQTSTHPNNSGVFYQILVYQYTGNKLNYHQLSNWTLVQAIKSSDSHHQRTVDQLMPNTFYHVAVQTVSEREIDEKQMTSQSYNVSFRTANESMQNSATAMNTGNNTQPEISDSALSDVISVKVEATRVHLSWSHSQPIGKDMMYYRVVMKELHSSPGNFPNMGSDTGDVYIVRDQKTWLTVSGLKPYQQYSVHLGLVKIYPTGHMVEGSGAETSFMTEEDAPSAPATVIVIPYPPHTLEVLWTQPLQLNGLLRGYHLNCSAPDGTAPVSITVGPDTYRYTITGLTSNFVYSIQVAAISIRQGPSHVLTQALKLSSPSPPRQLKAITMTSSIFLMWLPPSSPNGNTSHYKIYYGLDGQENVYSIHSVPSNDPQNDVTTELSGLKSGATYVISVTASNNAEQPESGPSNLITTQTQSELGQDGSLTDVLTSDGVLAILITETCLLVIAAIAVVGFGLWFCQQRNDMPKFDSTSHISLHPDSSTESGPNIEEEGIAGTAATRPRHIYQSVADLTAPPRVSRSLGYEPVGTGIRTSVSESLVTDVSSFSEHPPPDERATDVPGYEPISMIVSQ